MSARLVVLAGLPGAGKTTVGRAVADRLGATFLRVDSIESAVTATHSPVGTSPVGYVVAAQVAQDQLAAGRDVVVDAVNAVEVAREGWRQLAATTGARLTFVEVVCGDADEHRRRVEGRQGDWPGHRPPSWDDVQALSWEPFTGDRLLVENGGDPSAQVDRVVAAVG